MMICAARDAFVRESPMLTNVSRTEVLTRYAIPTTVKSSVTTVRDTNVANTRLGCMGAKYGTKWKSRPST